MNKKLWRTSTAVLFTLVLIIAGCSSKSSNNSVASDTADKPGKAKLTVAASFYPMAEFTKQVAGDLAEVTNLVPAGIEPHDWEATPQDMKLLEQADMLVYNGAGMENWVDKVLGSLSNPKLVAVEASAGMQLMAESDNQDDEADHVANEEEHEDEHEHGGFDPHVWLSPRLAIEQVKSIEAALSKADPAHTDAYNANAQAYIGKLEALDAKFKEEIAKLKRKELVTQHAAFGYLAKEYGLTQIPIAGLSPEQEPSAERLAELVVYSREHQVKAIFFETLVSSKVAETLGNEIGAKTLVLNPLEGLTADEEKQGLDYIGVMEKNLQSIIEGLSL
ncbi:metal ABC transporter substrate-binding protein [Paenibacillus sp. GCM10012307]|uniref:Zinc ABC transporter substrate-binding protein n=1 Tax=Paenibacillus roseus TaxID=2798579 RepID=A0A934IVR1_9BACL|nr:metal ABC transporter substrate-binding protein [Paenibacillus roseus]MBJ6360182.1 zinc ABC transporter substrate-binding protein [Paenibacillus roseus]